MKEITARPGLLNKCLAIEGMPDNRDIYRCAKLLIDRYGDDGALVHCDRRTAAVAVVGEPEGVAV